MRLLLVPLTLLLLTQPAEACGNAMEGPGGLNSDQWTLVAVSLVGILLATSLYLRSQSNLREKKAVGETLERFKNRDT